MSALIGGILGIYIPCGLDSVRTVIPSFHRRKRSDTIGRKNLWISSGFCSFGPGRMLVHIRFDVRYLKRCECIIGKMLMRHTDIQGEGYKLKRKRGTTNGRVRCCCLCTRTCCKSQIRNHQVVICTYQSTPRLTPTRSSPQGPLFSWGRFEKNSLPSGALSLRRHISPSKISRYSPSFRGLVRHSSNKPSTPGTLKMDLS